MKAQHWTVTTLTRRQRDVLHVLQFRAPLGDCWLRPGPRRNVWALWVPTMMTDRHLESLWNVTETTVNGMAERGLVAIGPYVEIPGTRAWGSRLTLCDAQ